MPTPCATTPLPHHDSVSPVHTSVEQLIDHMFGPEWTGLTQNEYLWIARRVGVHPPNEPCYETSFRSYLCPVGAPAEVWEFDSVADALAWCQENGIRIVTRLDDHPRSHEDWPDDA